MCIFTWFFFHLKSVLCEFLQFQFQFSLVRSVSLWWKLPFLIFVWWILFITSIYYYKCKTFYWSYQYNQLHICTCLFWSQISHFGERNETLTSNYVTLTERFFFSSIYSFRQVWLTVFLIHSCTSLLTHFSLCLVSICEKCHHFFFLAFYFLCKKFYSHSNYHICNSLIV